MPQLKQRILLGVCGGIAAYKTPDLVRKLRAQGADVRVVVTQSAKSFVSSMALQAVSGYQVSDDLLDPAAEAAMGHIELAKWADHILIAPATANFIAKLAHGLADDLLSTLCLASPASIALAPAMNQQMWRAPATVHNCQILAERGVRFFGPGDGEQACGDLGPGRMLEPQELADLICKESASVYQPLLNKQVLITAGPTREAIDPVRYLTNHSSGKMGYALATAAVQLGARVTLVSGPVNLRPPNGVECVSVQSALEMHQQVMQHVSEADVFIACAAVADYRPVHAGEQKLKKNDAELTLTFTRNPDILADVAALPSPPFTLGFAAETQQVASYAKDKLQRKNINMIAANDVSRAEIGFNSEQNQLQVFWPGGEQLLPQADKSTLATDLLLLLASQLEQ